MEPLTATDPDQIDGYVLEGRLGAGGYGVVYAATDTKGRRVALKVLRPELADNPGLKERLAREGAALGRVGGDRNVEIYKVVTEGTHTYLAMELVEGETLQERVERDGPLTGPILWFTAQGLIEALQAIHDAEITHRDLKPSNVMFGPDGVKVLDFGISAVADETGLTQTGAFLGTAAWISPEQILGREVTEKCDVFNLGLVVAYAATGRHAFGEGRPDAVMYRISNLDADLGDITEPLATALRRCLQREPGLRPSVQELLTFFSSSGQDDLPPIPDLPEGGTVIVQPAQIDKVVQSARQPSGEPPTEKPKRRKRRMAAAIFLLAALAGGGAFAFLQSQSDDITVVAPTSSTTTTSQATTETSQATTTTRARATTTTSQAATTTSQAATTTRARATTTTLTVNQILERTTLTASYAWGFSDETTELQRLLGLTADGYYGSGTRVAHLAVLNARGLRTSGVPSPPTTTTSPAGQSPSAPRNVQFGSWQDKDSGEPYVVSWESPTCYGVYVSWEMPTNTGGSGIKNWSVRLTPGQRDYGPDPFVFEGTGADLSEEEVLATGRWSGSTRNDSEWGMYNGNIWCLDAGTTYSIEVAGTNFDGYQGAWSAKKYLTPPATTTTTTTRPTSTTTPYPSAPRSIKTGDPVEYGYNEYYKARVTWKSPSVSGSNSVKEYEIQVTPKPIGFSTVLTGTKTYSLMIEGMEGGITYTIKVRAINHGGRTGLWSEKVYVSTPSPGPAEPIWKLLTFDAVTGPETIRWNPCAGEIKIGLNPYGRLNSSQLNEWETELRVLANELSEMSGLEVRYAGLTTEANRTEHPGDRPFPNKSDILITIGPIGTGLMEGLEGNYFGSSQAWVDGWTSSSTWEERSGFDLQVETSKATDPDFWGYSRRYLMYYFGYSFGLAPLDEGIGSEIMSWGSPGSGTANSPDWGPGDRHAFALLGAANGCLN